MTTALLEVCSENEGALGGPTFSPPLYRQRYAAALDLVRTVKPKKVYHICCGTGRGVTIYVVQFDFTYIYIYDGWHADV